MSKGQARGRGVVQPSYDSDCPREQRRGAGQLGVFMGTLPAFLQRGVLRVGAVATAY